MKITVTINGENHEVELAQKQLYEAYREHQRNMDIFDIQWMIHEYCCDGNVISEDHRSVCLNRAFLKEYGCYPYEHSMEGI